MRPSLLLTARALATCALAICALATCALAAGALAGCGGEGEEARPRPAQGEREGEPAVEARQGYSVHEWGLIDFVFEGSRYAIAAGPGSPRGAEAPAETSTEAPTEAPTETPTETSTETPTETPTETGASPLPTLPARPPQRMELRPAGRGKPVLYVHLHGVESVTFTATATVPGSSMAEHWPRGEPRAHGVRWAGVEARAGSCRGGNYPSPSDLLCTRIPDGVCEAAELRRYETDDGACLRFQGAQSNHLFYRGRGEGLPLPLSIVREPGGELRVRNAGLSAPIGELVRVRRGPAGVEVARAPMPVEGTSVTVALPSDSSALGPARESLERAVEELGLSEAERRAFTAAWWEELFGAGGEAPLRDCLLFFLPEENIDAWARLRFSPEPLAVRRAMLVRVILEESIRP